MIYKIYMELLWLFPKKIAHKIYYKKITGKKLDLKNPDGLNEKIHYLIINYYGKEEAKLTDKFLVKKYIEEKNISDLNIPKTYFTIENTNIDKANYPEKFILKCNHGSGDVFICKNKDEFDFEEAIKKLLIIKKKNFAKKLLEYHYKYIKPVIMCEELLEDETNERLIDYKFFCYNGKVDCVMVCTDRGNDIKKDFFDIEWKHLNYGLKKEYSNKKIKKPKNLKRMFEIAGELSIGHPFVRVDLYEVNNKIYFGELTFTPAAGLSKAYSKIGNKHLGKLLDIKKLPQKK